MCEDRQKKIEQEKHEILESHGPNVYCKSFHYTQRLFHFALLIRLFDAIRKPYFCKLISTCNFTIFLWRLPCRELKCHKNCRVQWKFSTTFQSFPEIFVRRRFLLILFGLFFSPVVFRSIDTPLPDSASKIRKLLN